MGTFVGRDAEMVELRAGFDDARAGRGRLFLIRGEPGIGKTRLADALAAYATANGGIVAWGRCWEGGGAPAYWPWVQVLRTCILGLDPQKFEESAGPGAGDLAQIIPEFSHLYPAPEVLAVQSQAAEQARFRLFESVSTLLKNYARTKPVLLVFDDLHEADQPSLLLLRFVARGLPNARILIVGTYRDTEVRRSPALGELVGALVREGQEILLSGLGEKEIARLVGSAAGRTPSEKLVVTLRQATAGNPLFLDGILRLLLAEGKIEDLARPSAVSIRLPAGVRETIRRQLQALTSDARSALVIAAFLGTEFELATLEPVSTLPHERLLDLLDEAVKAGIVLRLEGSLSRYRFSHALIRGVLYEEVASSARAAMHGKIAALLEEEYSTDPKTHLAELAHHFKEASAGRGSEKAIDYSIRAGEAANAVFAYEDAVVHLKDALAMMEKTGASARRRADLMVQVGDLAGITDRRHAVEYLENALRLYEGMDAMELAAEVHSRLGSALSLVSPVWNISRAIEHFGKAEAVLSRRPESASLGRLYIGIAMASEQVIDLKRGLDASARAMKIGERVGDEAIWTNAAVQHATYLLRGGRLREAFALYDEAWEKGDRLNEGFQAAWLGGYARMALWDPLDAQRWYRRELAVPRMAQAPFLRQILEGSLAIVCAFAGQTAEAVELGSQTQSGLVSGMLHLYTDDAQRAEEILTKGLEQAHRSSSRDEQFNYHLYLALVKRARGEHEQAEKLLEDALALCPADGSHRLWEMWVRPDLALSCVRLGKLARAQEHLARCREVLADGEDWRGLYAHFVRAAAVLAGAEGRMKDAEAAFAEAVATFHRYHIPFEESGTFRQWARALAAAGERDRASEKFNAALEILRSSGAGEHWIGRLKAERDRILPLRPDRQTRVLAAYSGVPTMQPSTAEAVTRGDQATKAEAGSIEAIAETAVAQPHDLRAHAAPDGTVTFLFSDVENSSPLFEKLGDLRAQAILRAHNAIVREEAALRKGFEVKSMGDGFMFAFSSARRALLCAIGIQRALAAYCAQHADEPVRVRIGLHVGETINESADFFGKAVILAARIAALATGGEILVSSTLRELTESAGDFRFVAGRDVSLKGLSGTNRIYRVIWQSEG